jgi:hypothetical protein
VKEEAIQHSSIRRKGFPRRKIANKLGDFSGKRIKKPIFLAKNYETNVVKKEKNSLEIRIYFRM